MADMFSQLQGQLRNKSPVAVDSPFSDISQYFAGPTNAQQTGAIGDAVRSAAVLSGQQDQAQQGYEKQNQINDLSAKIRGTQDQSAAALRSLAEAKATSGGSGKTAKAKYHKALNESGGFDFTDPNGNDITPFEYAQATGKSLSSVLANSLDPDQANFASDYKNVLNYTKVVANYAGVPQELKNKKALSQIQQKEANKQKLSKDEKTVLDYTDIVSQYPQFIKQTPQQVMSALVDTHTGIFPQNTYQPADAIPNLPQPTGESPANIQGPPGLLEGLYNRARDSLRNVIGQR